MSATGPKVPSTILDVGKPVSLPVVLTIDDEPPGRRCGILDFPLNATQLLEALYL